MEAELTALLEHAKSETAVPADEAARLAPHIACHGNVPNTTLMLPGLNAFTLGQLIAL
jgi:glucose-6-phosphate isomerase